MPTCAEALIDFLAAENVSHLFGIPGQANTPLYLATVTNPRIRPVLVRHEAGGGWMAYGYAEASGAFGVCTATAGPGATNLISPVVAAHENSIPILVVTGQVETTKFGRGAFQEMTGQGPRNANLMEMFQSACKLNLQPTSADELLACLPEVRSALLTGRRGPVHLNVPHDVLKMEMTSLSRSAHAEKGGASANSGFGKLKARLAQAQAPLVLIGHGCMNARTLLAEFLERFQLPHCTTIQAKDLGCHRSPLHLGIIGMSGSPAANDYLANRCDFVLVLGSSLGEFTTGIYQNRLTQGLPMARVDIDERELNRQAHPQLTFCMGVDRFLLQFSESVEGEWRHPVSRTPWYSAHAIRTVCVDDPPPRPGRVAPLAVIEALHRTAPDDAFFVADCGNTAVWATHYLQLRALQRFSIDINFGCMGGSIGRAIGIKLANPHKPVVCLVGDGAFFMNGMDILTATENGIGVCWVVFNDSRLGIVDQGQRATWGVSVATRFKESRVHEFAQAMGARTMRIEDPETLEKALGILGSVNGPVILDVRIDDQIHPKVFSRATTTSARDRAFAQALRLEAR